MKNVFYYKLPVCIMQSKHLKPQSKLVYQYLLSWKNINTGKLWVKTIANNTGLAYRTTQRALRQLAVAGFIRIETKIISNQYGQVTRRNYYEVIGPQ